MAFKRVNDDVSNMWKQLKKVKGGDLEMVVEGKFGEINKLGLKTNCLE